MHPRLFQIGSIAIPSSAVLTVVAIIGALLAVRMTARKLEIDPEKVWDLGIIGVLTALIAPRLILIFSNWSEFLAHPLWLIGLLRVRSKIANFGGIALAIAAMSAFVVLTRMPFRRTLDAIAPSLALEFAIADLGAFAGGSSFGTSTTLPWAVTYTSRLASIWNGAPLGTPVHPVQIYSAIAELSIFALLLVMIAKRDRWKFRSGEIMGAWLFLTGMSGFAPIFLRGDLTVEGFAIFASLNAAMTFTGGALWLPLKCSGSFRMEVGECRLPNNTKLP